MTTMDSEVSGMINNNDSNDKKTKKQKKKRKKARKKLTYPLKLQGSLSCNLFIVGREEFILKLIKDFHHDRNILKFSCRKTILKNPKEKKKSEKLNKN